MEYFNLDVIISLGYRVNSKRGIQFRQWATKVLKEFMLRGYAFSQRLNQLEDRIDRRMAKTEADVAELKGKVDFFVQTSMPPVQGVFYNDQVFDASVFAARQQDLRKRHREVQCAARRSFCPYEQELPRPLPDHRRQNALPRGRVAEGSRLEVLCLRETRRIVDPIVEGKGVRKFRPRQARPFPCEAARAPLPR